MVRRCVHSHAHASTSTQAAAEDTAAQIKAGGGKAEAYALNVADHEQSAALLHKLRNDGGRIDVLINNGGCLGCKEGRGIGGNSLTRLTDFDFPPMHTIVIL